MLWLDIEPSRFGTEHAPEHVDEGPLKHSENLTGTLRDQHVRNGSFAKESLVKHLPGASVGFCGGAP
jgi:hypothetical protein